MNTLFNGLFEFENQEDFDKMIESLDKNLSIKLLEFALENCTDKFSLIENHLIYKCLQVIKKSNS